MSATAANLIERVLPPSTALRQWVLTFPFSWRPRLAQDGELLGRLTQIFVDTVQASYVRRAAQAGAMGAKTGAVTVVQRTSSDLRLNPHLHTIVAQGQASRLWMARGTSTGTSLPLRALDISRPAKWAMCWSMRSGGLKDTFTGVACLGPGATTST